jgi:hypothetical protein
VLRKLQIAAKSVDRLPPAPKHTLASRTRRADPAYLDRLFGDRPPALPPSQMELGSLDLNIGVPKQYKR